MKKSTTFKQIIHSVKRNLKLMLYQLYQYYLEIYMKKIVKKKQSAEILKMYVRCTIPKFRLKSVFRVHT
jgi:hypothetical protein